MAETTIPGRSEVHATNVIVSRNIMAAPEISTPYHGAPKSFSPSASTSDWPGGYIEA